MTDVEDVPGVLAVYREPETVPKVLPDGTLTDYRPRSYSAPEVVAGGRRWSQAEWERRDEMVPEWTAEDEELLRQRIFRTAEGA